MRTDPWISCPRPKPHARLTLVCLPYAGGAAGAFRGWADRLPPSIDVAAVRWPGREARIMEAPLASIDALADKVVREVVPRLHGPYALFGHSLGALVAYEATRRLAARPPVRLFVSASLAPDAARERRALSGLPDIRLRAEVAALGGTPAEVLADDELWELVAPALRADFAACETYRWRPGPPLAVPLTVLGGDRDPDVRELAGWSRHTTGAVTIEELAGDHFFAFADPAPVLELVARDLAELAGRRAA